MFKKILSAALAVAMIAGMSVTAFAVWEGEEAEALDGELIFLDSYWYQFGDDNQIIGSADINELKPGDKIGTIVKLIELPEDYVEGSYDGAPMPGYLLAKIIATPKADDVKGWKVAADYQFDDAEDLVEEINIEPILQPNGNLNYYATIQFADDVEAIDPEDLVGTLTLYKRNKSDADERQMIQLNDDRFATVGYDSIGYDESGFENIMGEGNGAPVRDFDAADMNETAELYFEGVGYFFSGDVSTEAPKYLAFNYTPDYELLAKYPTADMEFINFPGMVKFNQFGSFELFKEPDQFAYAVVDGELVTLESIARFGKVVDGEDEGYSVVLQLKNFPESFVLSDTELEIAEAVEEVVEAIDAEPAA